MRTRVIFTTLLLAAFACTTAMSAQNQTAPLTTPDGKPTTAKKHIDNGLDCTACHGEGKKQPVESDKCLECHESFKAVSERTKDMKPNPHANHLVDSDGVECTQCHHGHKAMTVVCLRCHASFTFDRHK